VSLILLDGVDDGHKTGPSKWTSNGANYAGTPIHGGASYALQNGTTLFRDLGADENAVVGIGFYYKSTNIDQEFLTLRSDSGGTVHLAFTHNHAAGTITVRRGSGGTVLGTTSGSLMPSTVATHVEVRAVLHDTTGEVQIWIDGALALDLTGIDTKNGGTKTVFDRLTIFQGGGYSVEGAIDDLFIWVDDGVDPQDHVGVRRVITTYPTAEGTTNQWDGSDGNDVDNHLLVDEAGTPNTTDYVLSDADGEIELFAMGDLGSADFNVTAVQVLITASKADAGARSLRRVVRSGGANFTGPDVGLSETFGLAAGEILTLNPDGDVAWTPAAVDALEVGAEVRP
jgi:hypothetical protein